VVRPEAAFILLLAATFARADDLPPQQRLDQVEHDLDAKRQEGEALGRSEAALKAETARLQSQAVKAAAAAQDNERAVAEQEQALARLAQDESQQKDKLAERRGHEVALLTALERLSSVPPSAMAFQPGSPVDLARGGMLMALAVPHLEAEAHDLTEAVDQLNRMEQDLASRKAALALRQKSLDEARHTLAQTLEQRRALAGEVSQKARAAQQKVAALVAEAGDLRQAVERIERDRREHDRAEAKTAAEQNASAVVPRPAGAGPRLAQPVIGDVVRRFGEAEDYGRSKGISFGTRPGSQIVAPAAGEIMFAGPFKGYGQILIIDHGGGYHLLMAGIGRIQSSVGQRVVAGEPIGVMPSDGTPVLYFELRRDGQPVDPLPLLALHDEKASG
jgi:septal ring factor EnvC (AmiA/AmiB activator)